ncbi:MAG: helix-turn-helix domain-containing protein [Opitutales bacterium]
MKTRLEIASGRAGAVYWVEQGYLPREEHTHEELEVNLVVAGTGRYLIDSVDCHLAPGSLIWLFPEQEHVLLESSDELGMWVVVFRQEMVRQTCLSTDNHLLRAGNPGAILHRRVLPEQTETLDHGFKVLQAADAGRDHVNASLAFHLLECWRLYQIASPVSEAQQLHPSVFRAAQLLKSGEDDLAKIAKKAGLSQSRLSRLFHDQIGQSMTVYRNQERLKRFERLRQSKPRETLLALAIEAGFGSYAQFHRVYQLRYGRAPRRPSA